MEDQGDFREEIGIQANQQIRSKTYRSNPSLDHALSYLQGYQILSTHVVDNGRGDYNPNSAYDFKRRARLTTAVKLAEELTDRSDLI